MSQEKVKKDNQNTRVNEKKAGSSKMTDYKNKFIPYKKISKEDKMKAKKNEKYLSGMSYIASMSRGIKYIIGILSIFNNKALRLPKGVSKLSK